MRMNMNQLFNRSWARRSTPVRRKGWVAAVAVIGLSAFVADQAQAGFTEIGQSKRRREANHEQILEHVFDANLAADGVNFSGGGITATRLQDTGNGGNTDEVWNVDVVRAHAEASFARKKQSFGYFGGAEGSAFTKLFDVAGRNFAVDGGTTESVSIDGAIRFARGERSPRNAFSSDADENRDGRDHLITYLVSGEGVASPTYMLFWEDKTGRGSDWDFNDLVVRLETEAGGVGPGGEPVAVPVPAAAWMGLTGLLGLGAVRKARRWLA